MICANPSCRKKFTPKYQGQSVCSFECRMEKQRKDRIREKAKNTVKFAKPFTKPPLVGKLRQYQNTIYAKLKARWWKEPENHVCVCREELGCCKPGDPLTVHHAAGRENWLLLYTPLWKPICTKAHRKISDDSSWGLVRGYNVLRANRPRITKDDIQPICDKYGVELKLTS